MQSKLRTLSILICAFAIGGCSVGGGGTPAATTQNITAQALTTSTVAMAIHIPADPPSAVARSPKFVAQSTLGISISNFVHGSGIASFTASADLSPGSASCTAVVNARNCTITMTAVGGNDDFTIATYDVIPSNANFGSGAHQLGFATLSNITITAGQVNTVNVALGGIPKRVRLLVSQPSVYGPVARTFALGIAALDADGNVIVAGSTSATNGATTLTDTYANPISVSFQENGGTGHASLSLNGGVPSATVTVTKSSDAVTFSYDGNAASGYFVVLSAAAGGAVSGIGTVDSLFVSGGGPGSFTGGLNPTLAFTVTNQPETITLTEPNFTSSFQVFAPAPSANCPPNAIALNTAGLSSNGNSFALTAGGNTAGAGCVFTITDGTSVVQLGVTASVNGSSSTTLPVQNPWLYFTTFVSSLASQAVAPNAGGYTGGNAPSQQTIVRYNLTSGTSSLLTGSGELIEPVGVAYDAAGNIYVADFGAHAIFEYGANNTGNAAPIATIRSGLLVGPTGIALDASGNIYVADLAMSTVVVFSAGSNGNNVIPKSLVSTVPAQAALALDIAGDIFVANPSGVFEYAAPPAGNTSPQPLRFFNFVNPAAIAVDVSGNLYIAATGAPPNTVFGYSTITSSDVLVPNFNVTISSTIGGLAVDGAGVLYIETAGASSNNLAFQRWSTVTSTQIGSPAVVTVFSGAVNAQLGLIAR
jgi:hypothetical protein